MTAVHSYLQVFCQSYPILIASSSVLEILATRRYQECIDWHDQSLQVLHLSSTLGLYAEDNIPTVEQQSLLVVAIESDSEQKAIVLAVDSIKQLKPSSAFIQHPLPELDSKLNQYFSGLYIDKTNQKFCYEIKLSSLING